MHGEGNWLPVHATSHFFAFPPFAAGRALKGKQFRNGVRPARGPAAANPTVVWKPVALVGRDIGRYLASIPREEVGGGGGTRSENPASPGRLREAADRAGGLATA
jgi:hypothetical protein